MDDIPMKNSSIKVLSDKKLAQEKGVKSNFFETDKKKFIDSTLNANKNLDFVKRMYNTKEDIATPKGMGKPGDRSTHLMSYDPKSKRVYPEVVKENGKLTYKSGDKAYNYAEKTKEYIKFPTTEKAEYFASNYKKGTNVLKKK